MESFSHSHLEHGPPRSIRVKRSLYRPTILIKERTHPLPFSTPLRSNDPLSISKNSGKHKGYLTYS
jgi:hypothetical protein